MISEAKRIVKHEYAKNPVLFVFLSASLLFLLVYLFAGIVTSGSSIYETAFADHTNVFMDFFNSVWDSYHEPYTVKHVIYPPLAVFGYCIIGEILIPNMDDSFTNTDMIEASGAYALRGTQLGLMVYFILMMICVALMYEVLKRSALKDRTFRLLVVFLAFMSFPVVFTIERGNVIYLTSILVSIFYLFYDSDNETAKKVACFCLVFAIGIKLYPAVFALLYLRNRNYHTFLLSAVCSAILVFVPLLFIDGGIGQYLSNVFSFTGNGDSSGITLVHKLFIDVGGDPVLNAAAYAFTAAVAAVYLWILLKDRGIEKWKLLVLTVFMIVFVFGSNAQPYVYLYLLVPAVMFFNDQRRLSPQNIVFIALFLLIFILMPGFGAFDYYLMARLKLDAFILLAAFIMAERIFLKLRSVYAARAPAAA